MNVENFPIKWLCTVVGIVSTIIFSFLSMWVTLHVTAVLSQRGHFSAGAIKVWCLGIFPNLPFYKSNLESLNAPYHEVNSYSNYLKLVCNEVTTGSTTHGTQKPVGFTVRFGSYVLTCVSLLQVVYWRLVGVWEDMRWRDKDKDSSVYQEDQPCWGGDPGGHPLSDSPPYRTRVVQQPVLPAKVGHSGLVRGKTISRNHL